MTDYSPVHPSTSTALHQTIRRMSSLQFNVIPPPYHDDVIERRKRINNDPVSKNRQFFLALPITEIDVHDALLREVSLHSCWKSRSVRHMEIITIEPFTCLHYTLESFTEMRSTSIATEPYTIGQFLERQGGTSNLLTPTKITIDPWEYGVQPGSDFVEEIRQAEMPGTAGLAPCHSCGTDGCSHCFHCRGSGADKCAYCRGTGMKAGVAHPAVYTQPLLSNDRGSSRNMQGHGMVYGVGTPLHFLARTGIPPPGIGAHDLCHFCHGRGILECYHCKGHGKKSCATCGGSGSVRTFTKLKVKFAVERSEFYYNQGVPDRLVTDVPGEVLLAECDNFVVPLRNYPIAEVNEQSKRLCAVHLEKGRHERRILRQRQTLEAVPVVKVTYRHRNTDGVFWVYGRERLCYVPRYPTKCTIL